MRTENTEVLIVGAGPTGLLLACELARRAVSFRIIDKSPRPSQLSRGLGIHSRSLEIFEDLGLLSELVDRGFWLTGTSVFTNRTLSKRIPLDETRSESDPFPSLLIIEQAQVEQVLTDELNRQGIEVERSCELKNFAQSQKEVSVTLSRNKLLERLRCRYLIGCDGPKSKVRQNLGIDFVGFTYPKVYTLAEAKMEWNLDSEMYRFMGADSDLVAIPLGEDRFRLTSWENSEQEDGQEEDSAHGSLRDAPTSEHIQALLDKVAPIGSKVVEAKVLLRYKMELKLASSYGRGRCFIAGDACHVHPPTGAQGLNTGIQDAYNLGWKLASVVRGDCPRELLESYESERRPIGHWVLNNTHSAASSRFEMAGQRFFVLGQKFLMSRWNHLSVNYRESSIVAQLTPAGQVRDLQAGDRLPDGVLQSQEKSEEFRVFQLMSGTGHHLFVFTGGQYEFKDAVDKISSDYRKWVEIHVIGGDSEWPTASLWCDPEGKVAKAYAVQEPTLLFVRPDGYVGARAGQEQQEAFLSYLENCFKRKVGSVSV